MAAYRKISFARYALAGLVVMAPSALLEQTNYKWAWAYAVLIVLMLIVFYSDGLSRAASYTSTVLRKG